MATVDIDEMCRVYASLEVVSMPRSNMLSTTSMRLVSIENTGQRRQGVKAGF